jgi:hypothetical protein
MGRPVVMAHLCALGSAGANAANMRNWMSDRNIGPNNLYAEDGFVPPEHVKVRMFD